MKYAIVKIGGSQYKVKEGDQLEVARIKTVKKGDEIKIKDVLLLVNEAKVKIGQPLVKNANVKAQVIDEIKGKKIRVATYKAKSRYRRVKGFRPLFTLLKIEKISS